MGQGIFQTNSSDSRELINFSGIRCLSNRIFKFFRNNKCQRDKVSVQQNLQILKISKYHWDKFTLKKNLELLKTINFSGIRYLPNKIFRFLKLINFSRIRYLSNIILKFSKYNKYQLDNVSFQQNL